MSRVSLNSRLRAILDAAARIDPFATRLYRLPPATRQRYDLWRAECERLSAKATREGGPGHAYAMMLDGTLITPEPPRDVAEALGLKNAVQLSADLSADQVAHIYAEMIGD